MFVTQFERTPRVQFVSDKPSLTKQSFRDACDINNIMKRYERTGVLEHRNQYAAQYGDFTGFDDYQASMQKLQEADDAFASLPAKIRERFANHPGVYFDFANNPANRDELIKMGLLSAEKLEENQVSEPEIQK